MDRRATVIALTVVRLLPVLLRFGVYFVSISWFTASNGDSTDIRVRCGCFIIVGSVVLLLFTFIFLLFTFVVMFVSTTVSFAGLVVLVAGECIEVRTRVFMEVVTDLMLDVIVNTLKEDVYPFPSSVYTSASCFYDKYEIPERKE